MAGQLTIDTLKASSGVLATQNGMTGIAKAWVNFNGVTTTTIRGSFNVSSVTYSTTGVYIINFTTAMPNANYALSGMCGDNSGGTGTLVCCVRNTAPTTSSATIYTCYTVNNVPIDSQYTMVSVLSS